VGQPRLIFVNRFFYPNESATSQLLTDVCSTLADEGADVHVVASDRGERGQLRLARSEMVKSVKVRRVWSTEIGGTSLIGRAIDYVSFYPGAFAQLLRSARRNDVIVVKTDPPMFIVLAWLAAKIKRAKLIVWLQDLYPEVAIELGVRGLRGPLGASLVALRNIALRGADANVVIGVHMSDRLVAGGIKAARIHLLPNWSDDAIVPLRAEDSHSRQEWGIRDDVFVFGYSGNLGRAHEAETLLGAAKLLQHRRDICFLFVGSGHESHFLKRAITQAGLDNFVFQPHQPRGRLSHSLAASDAHWLSLRPELEGLIVPSKFYGIASAGRPVVAIVAKDGEIARAINDLKCGYVVEPGDSATLARVICELADNRAHGENLGSHARQGSDRQFARHLALKRWSWIIREVSGEQNGHEQPPLDVSSSASEAEAIDRLLAGLCREPGEKEDA
jgi:glycosyltransferase involved in cell wall biosynthesis